MQNMKNIKYTYKTRLVPGAKDGEVAIAIRLTDDTILRWVRDHDFPHTDLHLMSGPIADKLYAYENLGYSPEELKEIVEKHRLGLTARVQNAICKTLCIPHDVVERLASEERIKAMKDYVMSGINATNIAYMDWVERNEKKQHMEIKRVIFHDPATIVFWADGSKTVVTATNEAYDPEKGLAMAISKRALGDKGNYYEVFKKHLKEG